MHAVRVVLLGLAVVLGLLAVKTENDFVFAGASLLCGLLVSAALL
jgi:hypothetical protein